MILILNKGTHSCTSTIFGRLNILPMRLPVIILLTTFWQLPLSAQVFMRPFEKLIRCAIEDGTENTVENIKNLISVE